MSPGWYLIRYGVQRKKHYLHRECSCTPISQLKTLEAAESLKEKMESLGGDSAKIAWFASSEKARAHCQWLNDQAKVTT